MSISYFLRRRIEKWVYSTFMTRFGFGKRYFIDICWWYRVYCLGPKDWDKSSGQDGSSFFPSNESLLNVEKMITFTNQYHPLRWGSDTKQNNFYLKMLIEFRISSLQRNFSWNLQKITSQWIFHLDK